MYKVLVNCPGKGLVRLSDHLNMAITVDWDLKPQTKQNKHGHGKTLKI